jgi:hypothetical protein
MKHYKEAKLPRECGKKLNQELSDYINANYDTLREFFICYNNNDEVFDIMDAYHTELLRLLEYDKIIDEELEAFVYRRLRNAKIAYNLKINELKYFRHAYDQAVAEEEEEL